MRAAEVVVRKPFEILRPRLRQHEFKVADRPQIAILPVISEPRICEEFAANIARAIGRRIVGDHHFEIGKILLKRRHDRTAQIRLSVVDGDSNREAGRVRHAGALYGAGKGARQLCLPRSLVDEDGSMVQIPDEFRNGDAVRN